MTKKLRVDMICTVRWMDQTPNKTALKVGSQRTGALKNQSTGKIKFYLENWNSIREIRIDSLTTFQDMIVNLTANFSPAFFFSSSLDKALVCIGLIMCTNSHHGRIWDAGGTTDLTELCLSCSSTCDSRLTGLTSVKPVSVGSSCSDASEPMHLWVYKTCQL